MTYHAYLVLYLDYYYYIIYILSIKNFSKTNNTKETKYKICLLFGHLYLQYIYTTNLSFNYIIMFM